MSYSLVPSTKFKRSLKKYLKSKPEKNAIFLVLEILKENGFDAIPQKLKPHKLTGNYKDCFECHIMPDLLLIWQQDDEFKEIYLMDISSHSDLF